MRIYDETLSRAILHMHETRTEIRSQLADSQDVAGPLHGEFEAAIAEVIDELRPHVIGGDYPEMAKLWEKHNVDLIADFELRTYVREKEGKNAFGIPDSEQVREIQRVDMGVLLRVSQLLDQMAKELGLMPETTASGRSTGSL